MKNKEILEVNTLLTCHRTENEQISCKLQKKLFLSILSSYKHGKTKIFEQFND